MNWIKANFDDRQRKEIEFSRIYVKSFRHGTDGHNAKLIITQMSDMLDKIRDILLSEDHPGKLMEIEEVLGLYPLQQGENENPTL